MTTTEITITDLVPVSRHNPSAMTRREWLSLGILALEAADQAQLDDNGAAVRYFTALARKCDWCASTTAPTADDRVLDEES